MIIPKEIQALERLKGTLLAEGYWQDALEDINIIENALNEYYRLLKEDNETTKKLKALEIIVKKANIRLWENHGNYYFTTTNNVYGISKEKYDLLKEVLR